MLHTTRAKTESVMSLMLIISNPTVFNLFSEDDKQDMLKRLKKLNYWLYNILFGWFCILLMMTTIYPTGG